MCWDVASWTWGLYLVRFIRKCARFLLCCSHCASTSYTCPCTLHQQGRTRREAFISYWRHGRVHIGVEHGIGHIYRKLSLDVASWWTSCFIRKCARFLLCCSHLIQPPILVYTKNGILREAIISFTEGFILAWTLYWFHLRKLPYWTLDWFDS